VEEDPSKVVLKPECASHSFLQHTRDFLEHGVATLRTLPVFVSGILCPRYPPNQLNKKYMKIGILGTGMVGEALGSKLAQLGHQVKMGSRTANNESAGKWVNAAGPNASQGTFADAAAFAEILFVCLKGDIALDVVKSLNASSLNGKVVIDVSNPLDFSHGMPPSLSICNTNSLGEEIQRALPAAKVVKTLNIVNCAVMVAPAKGGNPTMLVSGNDPEAKATVTTLLKSFGWFDIVDLGDIATARSTEMLLPLWLSLLGKFGHPNFGFRIVQG
jgi:predicted dinucleotide-binding enzyme